MQRRDFIAKAGMITTALALNITHMETKNIISKKSMLGVRETTNKFEGILTQKGITVYARINQQAEAAKAGIALKGIEFLLFGNPGKGGQVMAENPEAALDLPLKLLVWEDAQHQTWVSYNDPASLTERFSLAEQTAKLTDIEPLVTLLLQE